MTMAEPRPPDLDHCVQILQNLSRDTTTRSAKSIGEKYVQAVGLLYHLKKDQITIQGRKQHEGNDSHDSPPYPELHSIPAISAVVHNQKLFRTLVMCLSSPAGDVETCDSNRQNMVNAGSRKRTHSIDGVNVPDAVSSKTIKVSHSPLLAKRTFAYAKPQINIRALAATILFVAFEHLDHWPVPLMTAYAEDCFGPRSWVDDPACQLLVRNLATCHLKNNTGDTGMPTAEGEIDAMAVAEFYGDWNDEKCSSEVPNPSPTLKRSSISSIASLGSFGAPTLSRPRSMSTDSATKSEPAVVSSGAADNNTPSRSDDSDSGEEEEIAVTTALNKTAEADGESSSSGEEDAEEVVVPAESRDSSGSLEPKSSNEPPSLKATYPVHQQTINFTRVRQRYFGVNSEQAHLAISSSLSKRLDVKSKQNSGLLQTLPSFTGIPSVRSLIAGNLEKWLQSPALAGLARGLFARTVGMMKNVDPPLPADLEAIDSILQMRLKANQLHAHVENVTAIAAKIPTAAVSRHIYCHLLREIFATLNSADTSTADRLKMVQAIHGVFPDALNAEGMASALLTLLTHRPPQLDHLDTAEYVKRMKALLRAVARELGTQFSGYNLVESLLSYDVSNLEMWATSHEENRARLMLQCTTLQCTTLLAGTPAMTEVGKHGKPSRKHPISGDEIEKLKVKLNMARKLLLRWCCSCYVPLFADQKNAQSPAGKKSSADDIVGAGPAVYESILDGINDIKIPNWLVVVRSVLFLDGPDSTRLRQFLSPNRAIIDSDHEWEDEFSRIRLCCEHGADVSDDLVWIVLNSATKKGGKLQPDHALALLEHLFNGCSKERRPTLCLEDHTMLWALYDLVEYTPRKRKANKPIPPSSSSGGKADAKEMEVDDKANGIHGESNAARDIPRLAFPGMWWRVTGLALIMCGSSPGIIGAVAWAEHPTLRALIKMVTSDRYRFPTVDCDDGARDEMKKTEQKMRDEEAKITESLFLPKKTKKKPKNDVDSEVSYGGARVSRRQKEKRERMRKKQQEKEAAEALKEVNRRKKLLRAAHKSIMLWDPKEGPRKPPKESADLIFSVGELFGLSGVFQRSMDPDFLLMTIGTTDRGAIERAYDWLIPIISYVPGTIQRLPASASCFLLLRAYGTEGEERAQLQELSAPLLVHVRQSLKGSFGEPDAINAFDLLLTDVASHNPDRRRCSRRVLHDALGTEVLGEIDEAFSKSKCAWMLNVLYVQHVESLVGVVIKHLLRASTFERGRVLRFLVLALDKLTKYAERHQIPGDWDFSPMLIGLISSRPTVFAATMGLFPDLRSLALRVVHNEFIKYTEIQRGEGGATKIVDACEIPLCGQPSSEATCEPVKVTLPLSLLESSCVLLSIWLESSKEVEDGEAVESLVRMLMRPQEADDSDDSIEHSAGLASAVLLQTRKSAIPVESWVMLARSRSDFVARRAALTAPNSFLPRLLLCSGLPRASLLTMIDRLGKLGEKAADKDKVFNQLLVPSASSEWDIGRLGGRREVSRKLMGRLSAYSRMYSLPELGGEDEVSFLFLHWLSDACHRNVKPRKAKTSKDRSTQTKLLSSIRDVGGLFSALSEDTISSATDTKLDLDGDSSDMTLFQTSGSAEGETAMTVLEPSGYVDHLLETTFERNETEMLEKWLQKHFGLPAMKVGRKRKRAEQAAPTLSSEEVSFRLLKAFSEQERKTESLGACVVKWVPHLSRSAGSPNLWGLLFAEGQKPTFLWSNLLARCCQAWTRSHLLNCRAWLFSDGKDADLDYSKVVRILVLSSAKGNIHVEPFADTEYTQNTWENSEESVRTASKFALECLVTPDSGSPTSLCSRNNPPDSVVLLVLIARSGRKQLQRVCQAVVERMEKEEGETRRALLGGILRLYAYFPQYMNLGIAILRSVLKEAVEEYANDWLSWRSPMDDQFEETIDSIVFNGAPARMVQALSEGSKKHPLLLLRKLGHIQELLEADGTARSVLEMNEKRGMLSGQSPSGPAAAKVEGRLTKVTIRHWGYNYTESVWISFLDVVAVVPREVLFGCGLKMGLLDFLGVYLRLMFVQAQLVTSERLSRLKGKLSDFFNVFKTANGEAWDSWLGQPTAGLPSLGGTRNILMICDFISHQQAIDNVKSQDRGK